MSLVLAGIDEAGYGPTLGPLTVGLSVLRVREWPEAETTPNLWKLLSAGVCRSPGRAGKPDKRGRVAVADSKELKLANSVTCTHPLVHLERGVLSFARHLPGAAESGRGWNDAALLSLLGAHLPAHSCYTCDAVSLPVSQDAAQIGIAANMVARGLAKAGVEVLAMRCEVVGERVFNEVVRATGSKAEATAAALGRHLRYVWERWGGGEHGRLGIVCDRLGGRASYAPLLTREICGCAVEVVEESEGRSRYVASAGGRRAGVAFLTEGENAHLPVALASMIAKFVRELAMMRFNRHWSWVYSELKGGDLKPTAGYSLDARRWLSDVGEAMNDTDRAELVRII